jgi:hypothetical protein
MGMFYWNDVPEKNEDVVPSVVLYACNPSYLGGRGRRIMV